MTTYATSTTQPAPPIGGPPAPPPLAGGLPTERIPRRRRAGIITAAGALVIAAVAMTATAVALASPITPAQHTVNVVPPPAEYNSAEIQAAKESACASWDQAARALASAGKIRAALGDTTGGSSPQTREARTNEKLVGISQIAHLRSEISAAAGPELRALIQDWTAAQIDSLHGTNVRDWNLSNSARDRGNDLVDVIAPACGLR